MIGCFSFSWPPAWDAFCFLKAESGGRGTERVFQFAHAKSALTHAERSFAHVLSALAHGVGPFAHAGRLIDVKSAVGKGGEYLL